MKIICSISGLQLSVSAVPYTITKPTGYYHPIFSLKASALYTLYSKYCEGSLDDTSSYLLFLAFLHGSGSVDWRTHATLSPSAPTTKALIANNIYQLISVLEKTAAITVPSFIQPTFVISNSTASLDSIPNWIKAWEKNIEDFHTGYRNQKIEQKLREVENKLTYYIYSGNAPATYATQIANWANAAACFPSSKVEYYKQIIRTCYSAERMFSTPLKDIKEVKAYCEENIEVGSIHFHTLMETLNTGIKNHSDFLGYDPSSIDPAAFGYEILPIQYEKQEAEIEKILQAAPSNAPSRIDYSSDKEYLKAKLAYRIYLNRNKK